MVLFIYLFFIYLFVSPFFTAFRLQWNRDIYLGNMEAAKDVGFLKAAGIQYVLNCAEGINLGAHSAFILQLKLEDVEGKTISEKLPIALRFIDRVLENHGRILVHCRKGRCR